MGSPESYRVLLVDDDARLLESMAAVLADQFGVRCCASGQEALRLLDNEPFHVVCADWQMPGMDGVEFFHAAARRKLKLLSCFVLVTAHAVDLMDRVPYEDRKMLGMLRKPFSPEQLIERVNQFAGVAHLKRSNATLKAVVLGERK
ncbi:MAG: response regulator [Myxococcales bacterium]|jgi:two-component system response regulator HupR/HoxA